MRLDSLGLLLFLLIPIAAQATDYHATTSGSGSTCSSGTPCSITTLMTKLTPGDTGFLAAGTYTCGSPVFDGLGAGTDFATGAITIQPEVGQTATLIAPAGDHVVNLKEAQHHIIFSGGNILYGLKISSGSIGVYGVKMHFNSAPTPSVSAHHIRLINCEVYDCNNSGIGADRSPTADAFQGGFNEFINLYVHDNGLSGFDHGFYLSTPSCLVDGCTVAGNSGYGVQIDADDAVNSNSIVRNCTFRDSSTNGAGIVLSAGSGHKVYNNVFYGTGGGVFCDQNASVFNNTIDVVGYGIYYYGSGSGVENIQNNIVITQNFYAIFIESGSGVHTIRNNLTNGASILGVKDTPGLSTISGNIDNSGYSFVDRTGHNYHILTGSTAKDAGLDLSAQGFSTDVDGNNRPQGSAWDMGFDEFLTGTPGKLLGKVALSGGISIK